MLLGDGEDVGRRHHRVLRETCHRVHRERRAVGPGEPRRAVVERAAQAVDAKNVSQSSSRPRTQWRQLPARHDERGDDAVARREAGDAGADLLDDPRDLVAEHARRRERDLALHHVQIGVAHAAPVHAHEHLAGERSRPGRSLDAERLARPLQHHRAHHRGAHLADPLLAPALTIGSIAERRA